MLTFTRVPVISKSLEKNRYDSDRQRKLYAKSFIKRNTTLKRLNALNKKGKLTLDYCSIHQTNNEVINIPYRDMTNTKTNFTCVLKLPLDVKRSPIILRSNTKIVRKCYDNSKRKRESEARHLRNGNVRKKRKKFNKKCDVYGCLHTDNDDNTYFKTVECQQG